MNTGVVSALFVPDVRKIVVSHHVVLGLDVRAVSNWLRSQRPAAAPPAKTFVEKYRPRSHFDSDKRMVEAMGAFRKELPRAKQLDNTGIKSVVKEDLLRLLGLWNFSTPSHHGDLRSAARIMVLGLLKDEEANTLLADIVKAHLDGRDWHVEQR